MRVIAGTHRGRTIVAPPGRGTRPMLARVREAIFNRLAPWLAPGEPGARVLDLFAGSGSLGLEALSRGAAFVRFVERGEVARQTLTRNLTEFGLLERAEIVSADALGPRASAPPASLSTPATANGGPAATWDVVFFDPPYPLLDDLNGRRQLIQVAERIVLNDLAPDGVFVFHAPARALQAKDFPDTLEVAGKDWGTTAIWFLGRSEV